MDRTDQHSAPAAAGSVPLGLTRKQMLDLYRRMVTIRRFEEQVYDVYSRGIMPGLAHLYTGMEAIAVGVCAALRKEDHITSTHRGHGHLLAKGGDPERTFAELLGKADGYNRGKGGSMHIVDMSLGILGANGIVGGGIGIATGAALSAQLQGEERVSVCFFGDGALNEGLFYEAANMASLWRLPVVYVMENNQYGEYTRTTQATAGTGGERAEAMAIPARTLDGNDVLAVHEAAVWATDRARAGEGPSFLGCETYRWRGHHMGDQGDTYGYRSQEEIEIWKEKCPIQRFAALIEENGLGTADDLRAIRAEAETRIDEAISYAQDAPFPSPAEAFTDVYA